jgi:hypothetical protein
LMIAVGRPGPIQERTAAVERSGWLRRLRGH